MKTYLPRTLALGFALGSISLLQPVFSSGLYAQSVTAGDIQGIVTDPSGAVVPNAQVSVKNAGTGTTKTATSSASGAYRVSLLAPGTYIVTVQLSGFNSSSSDVTVGAGNVSTDDVKLQVGNNTTVEVSAAAEIVNTDNGNIETVFSSQQVQALPNPGNDLTFVAQTAPGSVMNTGTASGGYGNFSSFGISGVSNMFTLDGGYENDPFLNLNNTGASNLTLGNNEVDTVSVVSPAYSAQFGGLGGAQVNEITLGGTNRVHGNANYYWSGRALNANDWFNKQNEVFNGEQNIPSFVNANQWSARIGGPLWRDKLFFFVNTEGLRVTTPKSGQVYVPSAAFQNCSLTGAGCADLNAAAAANCANNPSSTCTGANGTPFAQAPASQVPLLTSIYNVFNNSPFRPAASAIHADPNDVSADTYFAKNAAFLSEWLLMGRLDWHIGNKDNFFVHYKQDKGTQPTYTDLVTPLFTDASPQPAWEGQMSETHTFTSNLINQLVVTGNYYSAPFQNSNNYQAVAPFTFAAIDGDLSNANGEGTTYGGIDYAFPQGRRVAGYQVIDDVSYNKGRNSMHFGYNLRRDNITDITAQLSSAGAYLDEGSIESFGAGQVGYVHVQNFPQAAEQRVGVYNMGVYFEDSYKATPTLTITAGIRLERNSNPTCRTSCLQTLSTSVADLPTGDASATAPYNSLIDSGRYRSFLNYQKLGIMPRVSFAYQPGTNGNTVIRGGFGMFTDTFPGQIADALLNNAPTNFGVNVYGSDLGAAPVYLDPSTAGSAASVAVASNAAFHSSYATGGSYNTISAAVTAAGGAYSSPNFTTTAPHISYPTYEEFSLAIEQKLGRKSSISATYVGNHGYKEPYGNGGANLTFTPGTGVGNIFPTVPQTTPVTPFSTITNYSSGATSNYNGVVLSAVRHAAGLTLQFNYEFSKALDEISNGGFNGYTGSSASTEIENPNNLAQQYGPADYNVKHNTTASAVYDVPAYHRLKAITGGFEIDTVVFHQSGLPYSIGNSTSNIGAAGSSFSNGNVNLLAQELNSNFDHHCGGGNHTTLPDGSNPNPCNFVNSFGAPTDFGQQGRNSLVGPSYTNIDFGAFKIIPVPHYETLKFKLGAQFFNLFNHPNFAAPSNTLTGGGTSSFGAITSTVSSPTNIFGSVGANSSPRLIQLKANVEF